MPRGGSRTRSRHPRPATSRGSRRGTFPVRRARTCCCSRPDPSCRCGRLSTSRPAALDSCSSPGAVSTTMSAWLRPRKCPMASSRGRWSRVPGGPSRYPSDVRLPDVCWTTDKPWSSLMMKSSWPSLTIAGDIGDLDLLQEHVAAPGGRVRRAGELRAVAVAKLERALTGLDQDPKQGLRPAQPAPEDNKPGLKQGLACGCLASSRRCRRVAAPWPHIVASSAAGADRDAPAVTPGVPGRFGRGECSRKRRADAEDAHPDCESDVARLPASPLQSHVGGISIRAVAPVCASTEVSPHPWRRR